MKGEFDKAIADFTEAIRLDPRDVGRPRASRKVLAGEELTRQGAHRLEQGDPTRSSGSFSLLRPRGGWEARGQHDRAIANRATAARLQSPGHSSPFPDSDILGIGGQAGSRAANPRRAGTASGRRGHGGGGDTPPVIRPDSKMRTRSTRSQRRMPRRVTSTPPRNRARSPSTTRICELSGWKDPEMLGTGGDVCRGGRFRRRRPVANPGQCIAHRRQGEVRRRGAAGSLRTGSLIASRGRDERGPRGGRLGRASLPASRRSKRVRMEPRFRGLGPGQRKDGRMIP